MPKPWRPWREVCSYSPQSHEPIAGERRPPLCIIAMMVVLLWPAVTQAKQSVEALFSTDRTYTAPFNTVFPSNVFTTADATQNTGLRLDFAPPNCGTFGSACESLLSLNELDGFNLQPQLTMRFSSPIDVATVTSRNFFLIRLGDAVPNGDQSQKVVGINQISFHTENNVLSAESDEFLDEHTRYVVIVTRDIRDRKGQTVLESKDFKKFRQKSPSPTLDTYRQSVLEAMQIAAKFNVDASDIVAASVFTTQSASAVLEKIRDQIKVSTPEPADFHLGPNGERTVFAAGNIAAISLLQQVKTNTNAPDAFVLNPTLSDFPLAFQQVHNTIGQVGYGTYQSPTYLQSGPRIPSVGTKTGVPVVQGTVDIFFTVLLPSGTKPPDGWPVVIVGTGDQGTKDDLSYFFAPYLAARGMATIVLRAGDLADRATLYRHDLVFADPVRNPTGNEVTPDAHRFNTFQFFDLIVADIGLQAQNQITEFLASDGQVTIDPDGPEPIFETPIVGPLPEDCGFVVPFPGFTACK